MNNAIVECKEITKFFHEGESVIQVLNSITLSIESGEHVAIMGSSGSGKSTLLHILAGLEQPNSGTVEVLGKNIHQLSENERSKLRNEKFGFIYQFHHLLPEFSALENVAMPLLIHDDNIHSSKLKASELLTEVGLDHRLHHKPHQLSGGERQRVAIARALIMSPACVFADEPTGNLDARTAQHVYELLQEMTRVKKTAFVIVTHDQELANKMDKIYCIKAGLLHSFERPQ